jgi:hypothetical protein
MHFATFASNPSREIEMTLGNPYKTGATLSVTVAIGYALCTLAFWVFPEASANFMNALFHGLDFTPLKSGDTFTFASFLYGIVVLAAWAFFMGTVFAWVAGLLRGTGGKDILPLGTTRSGQVS